MKKPPSNFTRRQIIKGISASSLVPLLGANLIGVSFLIELSFLGGREKIENHAPVYSVITY